MRTVIQRVTHAKVDIDQHTRGSIGKGLLVLVGFESTDNFEDIEWISGKILRLRIFDDADGVMNLSITDIDGEILVVSQFTLHAKTKKGNRPSYIQAAPPDVAIPLYESFVAELGRLLGKTIQTGEFGAHMDVHLVNSGPVTIIMDSKNRE